MVECFEGLVCGKESRYPCLKTAGPPLLGISFVERGKFVSFRFYFSFRLLLFLLLSSACALLRIFTGLSSTGPWGKRGFEPTARRRTRAPWTRPRSRTPPRCSPPPRSPPRAAASSRRPPSKPRRCRRKTPSRRRSWTTTRRPEVLGWGCGGGGWVCVREKRAAGGHAAGAPTRKRARQRTDKR